jgi:hypothetical protein
MGILLLSFGLVLPLLPPDGQVMAQSLQPLPFLLVL